MLIFTIVNILQEVRKRAADSDDEMDKGRTKKVKKNRDERNWSQNPFQVSQSVKNLHIVLVLVPVPEFMYKQ